MHKCLVKHCGSDTAIHKTSVAIHKSVTIAHPSTPLWEGKPLLSGVEAESNIELRQRSTVLKGITHSPSYSSTTEEG
jgi:hypothetical protein